jgi:hypothetical protein
VLTHFINCSPHLTTAATPSMADLLKEDGLYESTQHFFANYVHQMLEQFLGLESLKEGLALSQDKDLRKVQVLLLQNLASGFDKCKFLKDEYGEPFARNGGPDSGRAAAGRPPKLHHDEGLIEQITSMGFDRISAKKALKLTGDVSNAVTFLLESGEAGLDQVSVSEEEDPAQAERAEKEAAEKANKEEAERKLRDQQRQERRADLVSTEAFKTYLREAQEAGLGVVTEWCCLTPEKAKLVSLKTQRKYAKVYDHYVLTLFKSPDQKEADLLRILDAILSKYTKLTNFLQTSAGSGMEPEELSVMLQDTKTQLNLVTRLTSQPSFEALVKQSQKERNATLRDNVVRTLQAIVGSANNEFLLASIAKLAGRSEKQRFGFLSNTLELLFRSLLLLLRYQQAFQSKLARHEHKLEELNSKEHGDGQAAASQAKTVSEVEQKVANTKKKIRELALAQVASDCTRFVKTLKQHSASLKVARKYAHELNQVIGQIVDVARLMLLQKVNAEDRSHDLDLVLPGEGTGAMTTASSTLNIVQVQ